jgi:antiviral helicase SKI2
VLAITDGRVKTDAATLLGDDSDSNTSSFRTSKHTLTPDAAACACRALADLDRLRFGATPPKPLHPTKDLKIADVATVEAMHLHGALVTSLPVLPASVSTKLRTFKALLSAMRVLRNRIGDTEHAVSDANLRQMPDFEQRVRVLRRMGYLDHDKTVTLKGRVACEIATGDELVGTEIIFSGVLTDLSPEQAVAVLSALVFQEKNASAPDFSASPELKDACASCFALAVGAGETQVREGLQIDPSEYASSSLKFGLVEVVNEWAKGCAFGDACSFSDVQEGSIVRTITRLDEMTRDVRNAARIMGDSLLFQKMELASAMIKRDIVFSASLYVAGAK